MSVGRGMLLLLLLSLPACAPLGVSPEMAEQILPAQVVRETQKVVKPENARAWAPDQAILPYATIDGDDVTVHNVRNCHYLNADTYVLRYYDRTFRLSEVECVDFFVMPFENLPLIAHTMLSFGLSDGSYLGVSVEIRREDGERYGTLQGFLNRYEIMYVIGDERDLVQLCTNHLNDDVYLYRTRASPEQAQQLLLDVLERAGKLREEPEFYNTLTNNCTTNIARHVNSLSPERVPLHWGVLFPGMSDRLAYDLGLLATDLPFEEARERAYISETALRAAGDDFSRRIREPRIAQ